jgi:pimeloyl-ACP methyl ester carboxylesterase
MNRTTWRRRVLRVGLFTFCLYLAVLVVLLCLEDRLLYRPAPGSRVWCAPLAELGVEEVSLTSSDGTAISAWFMAPPGWRPEAGAVLLSHGTNGNVSTWQRLAGRWQKEVHRAVLVYDYPGYGKSGGRPSEQGCYAAAECAFAFLTQQKKVPPRQVILVGSSLGSAMATELAVRHDNRLLVLVGAFTSFPDVAQARVPCYPSRWLVHNRLDNLARIAHIRGPVFLVHGTEDGVVPFWMGQRLHSRAPRPRRFYAIAGHRHSHPHDAAFFAAVRAFLDQTRAR